MDDDWDGTAMRFAMGRAYTKDKWERKREKVLNTPLPDNKPITDAEYPRYCPKCGSLVYSDARMDNNVWREDLLCENPECEWVKTIEPRPKLSRWQKIKRFFVKEGR